MGADIFTIGGLVLGGISTIADMGSQASAANAQAAQYAYQAQVASNNAEIARQNERLAAQRGEAEATAVGLKNKAMMGQLFAEQAASGVDVNTGSAASVRQSAAVLNRLDALTIRSNASLEAFNFRTQADNYLAQGGLYSQAAASARRSKFGGVAGSLLTGASSVTGKYLDWQAAGGFGGGARTIMPSAGPAYGGLY